MATVCAAHEGEVHERVAASALSPASADRPRRLPNGDLYVPKTVQRLLGIRTEVWPPRASAGVDLVGEVQPQAGAAFALTAPEAGRLEPPEQGWPLPGAVVQAGEVLAWLRPAITAKDSARRRAQIADIEQKRVIADIDVQRLALQNAVNGDGGVARGNVYYEQALAERTALVRQHEQLSASLAERLPLRAPVGGRVLAVSVQAGDVAKLGQTLFEIADRAHLRVAVQSFDATLGSRLRSAKFSKSTSAAMVLRYRGTEPLVDAPGWRLLFDIETVEGTLSPGQLVDLRAETADAAALPDDACVTDAAGRARLWLHPTPERFMPITLSSCAALDELPTVPQGARRVLHGAAALAAYGI